MQKTAAQQAYYRFKKQSADLDKKELAKETVVGAGMLGGAFAMADAATQALMGGPNKAIPRAAIRGGLVGAALGGAVGAAANIFHQKVLKKNASAQQAYSQFKKQAEGGYQDYGYDPYQQAEEEALLQQVLNAEDVPANYDPFQDPNYESPLERKRKIQGAGSAIGSGAGMLGGALSGAMIPKSKLMKILGGVGGGLGGMALGGMGGWGLGSLLARARMGNEYPEE